MGTGKGHSVVGANGCWQAKLPEYSLKNGKGARFLGAVQSLTGEQIAGMLVGDGQGIAIATVAKLELAFEIGAPQGVG